MGSRKWIAGISLAALLANAGVVSGQAPAGGPPRGKFAPGAPPPRFRPGGPGPGFAPMELLGFDSIGGHEIVKGAPFSATAVLETTHLLADGNRIHRSTKTQISRDAEGRVRKEVTLQNLGPLAGDGRTHTFVVISDPAAGVGYRLDPEQKIAWKHPLRPAGDPGRARERFQKRAAEVGSSGNLRTETLGNQKIDGISAEGTRYTITLPAGQVGNEKPIQMVIERWYSIELRVMVMVKRTDPRFGESVYRLTNIQRQAQDASLFQVPSDFEVTEKGPGMRRPGKDNMPPPPPPGMGF